MSEDDNNLTLFYYYVSYYSQKALLALFEKDCKFERKIINIQLGEQNEPEYMRMNPNGLVPMLKDGQKIVVESEKIVDYIDSKVKSDVKLVPDESTPIGKEAKRLRQMLDVIKIDVATYGVVYNEEFSVTGLKLPKPLVNRMRVDNTMEKMWDKMKEMAEKYPDLRDAYLSKVEKRQKFMKTVRDKGEVSKVLDDMDRTCDQLEDSLRKTKQVATSGQEVWMVGPQFTVVDVHVVIFMDRMTLLGLEDRFFSKEKRPLLHDYRQRIGQRKSVQMLRAEVRKAFTQFLWTKVKSVIPYVAGATTLGVAVGLGIWFLKNK